MTPDILAALNWRYACKAFDSSKKISAETWQKLEQSLVLTPSSFGLQPWKFLVVQDPELREKLVPHAWNQRQVADCSHLVIMTVPKALGEDYIDANIARMVEVRGACLPIRARRPAGGRWGHGGKAQTPHAFHRRRS
jgi:nitroreductase